MPDDHDELGRMRPPSAAASEPKKTDPTTPKPSVQLVLDSIYLDRETPQSSRDALTDWLLDTQSHTAALEIGVLLPYLATQQPDLLKRLKNNWRVRGALASALALIPRN